MLVVNMKDRKKMEVIKEKVALKGENGEDRE